MEFATALLPKLAQLLQEEYNLQKSAREGIEFLYKELETMHAALRKVGEVPREQLEELHRIWAQDVRELSYDMEDIVDTFMVDVEGPDPPSKRGAKKILKKMIKKINKAMARREIAHEIKDVRERAKELAERRDRYKVVDIAPAKRTPVDPRLKALYTETAEIVGIEEAKKEVIKMLTEGDGGQQKRIVSIAGFGGLGKTTLAKAVHDEIEGQFDCTAFVSVSRNPDAKKLLKDMLYQLDNVGHPGANFDELKHFIDLVRKFLKDKRYLIVIDDIWDKEPWDEVIRHALIKNERSSRIITTTRIIDVAEHVGGCYRLKPLSDESSDMLFYGRIFGSKDKCPGTFSEVSKKILKKCGGVPLAIVTTSSLLAANNKSDNIDQKWQDVGKWQVVCNSIGSGLGSNPDVDSMRKILLLSYYDLPCHLKTCLLYLSIFPEDYVIRKNRLIWRWVAEGFVQEKKGDQSFLEIAESYFNELVNRSLIQPVGMDEEGTPEACRVHDTVLDLIISLSTNESFITNVIGGVKHSLGSKQVRWLSLHDNTTWPTMKIPKLRSLTIFKPAGVIIDPTPSLSRYLLLRVLDLRGCRLENLASLGFLGSLSHLRYLGLSSRHDTDTSGHQLPVEIGKLRFLQTLDLSETAVEELASSVVAGLGQLRCLRGGGSPRGTRLPDGLKNLTSLEVLESAAVTSKSIAEQLGHLTQLRLLEARVRLFPLDHDDDELRACTKALVESLGKLTKIQSLHIRHSLYDVDLDSSMEEPLGNLRWLCIEVAMFLPTWIRPSSLPGLSYLDISVEYERREDIQILGTLPCLRHLKFRVMFVPKQEEALERCVVGPDAFPCAVRCEFYIHGRGVVPCMFPRGAMPKLQDFTFNIDIEREQFWSGGGSTTVDDLALGHLPSLRNVTVLGRRYGYEGDDEATKEKIKSVREKLEHEAAVHPNHHLRIHWRG
ncbi:Disease resistance protein RPP13 [Dichanthelium oligosanthes]|uniref:Disease resistance protein RPP13 n=1 Tax=Dichanthelium oligosanthes TaxID=888268 RepID=A0A1E5UTP7_9POAL|nr:Disease resistance protein RPP13 [Dichanthelium oligosanthes]